MPKKTDYGKTDMNGPDDKQREEISAEIFEQYLDGESAVSEAYRHIEQAEPSSALDRAVLNEARDAARPRPKGLLDIDLRFWRHWGKPLSTVVIMGVCLTVVLRIMDYETLTPATSLDTELAVAEQKLAKSPAAIASADSQAPRIGYSEENTRRMQPRSTSPAEPARRMSAALPDESSLEEISVTSRKRSESLQDVPLAMSASRGEEVVVTARKSAEESSEIDRLRIDRFARADDALLVWNQGARPAADVWAAGIQAVYARNEPHDDFDSVEVEGTRVELARMSRVYPDAARSLKEESDLFIRAEDTDAYSDSETVVLQARELAPTLAIEGIELTDELADPIVWAAGIEWLYENDRDSEAAAELTKLRRIYPQFELD